MIFILFISILFIVFEAINSLLLYEKCGGNINSACTPSLGLSCFSKYAGYSECRYICPNGWGCKDPNKLPMYAKCGGSITTPCSSILGLSCLVKHAGYSECRNVCPLGWGCQDHNSLPMYARCGGGIKTPCSVKLGLKCHSRSDFYAECLDSCPSGWLCKSHISTSTNNFNESIESSSVYDKWMNCDFKFGLWYDSARTKPVESINSIDYFIISIGYWLNNQSNSFDPKYHGAMLDMCNKYNKLVVFNSYIIGFMGNHYGLPDCNVRGLPNLCSNGADMIRIHNTEILNSYDAFAAKVSEHSGKFQTIVWLIEPDFYQYYSANQSGRPLSGIYMRILFDNIAIKIKKHLPNSIISWDISAWATKYQMILYWSYFTTSPYIDFIHTSGGISSASTKNIWRNGLEWRFMSKLTGKRTIADTGRDTKGNKTGFDKAWNNATNINARIDDGVIGVAQDTAPDSWSDDLNELRKKLKPICLRK